MPEWPIGAVSKTVVRVIVPRVRIPLSPPDIKIKEMSKEEAKRLLIFMWFLYKMRFRNETPRRRSSRRPTSEAGAIPLSARYENPNTIFVLQLDRLKRSANFSLSLIQFLVYVFRNHCRFHWRCHQLFAGYQAIFLIHDFVQLFF